MRPIKFRAFIEKKKKILAVERFFFEEGSVFFTVDSSSILTSDDDYPFGKYYQENVLRGKDILMQYIGLKDMKSWDPPQIGNEVYEGDIIQSFEKSTFGKLMVIDPEMSFNCGCCGLQYGWDIPFGTMEIEGVDVIKGKIIGNIYENPELLETPE